MHLEQKLDRTNLKKRNLIKKNYLQINFLFNTFHILNEVASKFHLIYNAFLYKKKKKSNKTSRFFPDALPFIN